LAKTVVDMEADNFTLHSQSWGSVELTKEWAELRRRLAESKLPPPDLFTFLDVGEELPFPLKCFLQIPKTSFNNGTRMMYGWEIYGEYSRLWLKIEMVMWPPNLEEPNAAWPEGPLAKKLYKRWKDYGVLWYTFIKSEPIPIQLDEARMEK
jgi:hypothetical protein